MGDGSANITIKGCTESCPRCGSQANLLDGTYSVLVGVLTAICAPEFTLRKLRQFSSLIARASRNEIDPNDLEAQATAVDPKLGEIVKQIKTANPSAWVVTLLILMAMIKGCNFKVDATVDLNRLFDQAVSYSSGISYMPSANKVDRTDENQRSSDTNTASNRPRKKHPTKIKH